MRKLVCSSLLLLFISVSISCKKNTDDNKPGDNTPKPAKCYLHRAYDEGTEVKVTYNATMQMELLDFRDDGRSMEAYRFKYDNKSKATGYDFLGNNEKLFEAVFFYNPDSTLSKVVAQGETEDGPKQFTVGYVYDANKQLIRVNEYRENSASDIGNYQLYTYNAGGNLIKTESYYISSPGEQPTFSGSAEYEYDTYKNPMKEWNLPIFLNDELMDMSPNNVTKLTYKDAEGNITSTTQYQYTYNTQGYPATEKSIYDDGDTYNMQFEYNCK